MIIIEVSKAIYNDVPKALSQRPSTLMSQRPYRYVRVVMASGVNFGKLFRVRVRVLGREGGGSEGLRGFCVFPRIGMSLFVVPSPRIIED
jgi:hypothetical protein